jgi:Recombinase
MNPATTPGDGALAYVTGPGDRQAITDACPQFGLEVGAVISERDGDDSGDALHGALDDVAAGAAQCLVVRRLGDLRRGAGGLAAVLDRVEAQGIRLVSVDVGLDTDRPLGRLALARHTRTASPAPPSNLAAARAAHPADIPALRKRIAAMRAGGMTLQAIADVLNDEGVPTQRGGAKWRPSSVQSAAGYRRPKRGRAAGGVPDTGPARGDERS